MNYSQIEKLRKERRVSKKEIADHLKMTVMGYSKMIEKQTCTVATLEMIADYYNKPLSFFLGDESNEESTKVLKVYPGSNLERVLSSVNKQAGDPVIDFETIKPEKAIKQLLNALIEKDIALQNCKKKYDELNEKYVAALEELAGKKGNVS